MKTMLKQNQTGFLSLKAALVGGVILSSSLIGTTVYASTHVPFSSTLEDCISVKAYWADDPDINATVGCEIDNVIVGPGEEETPDESDMWKKFECGADTVLVTNAMWEHSKANALLKSEGEEMIPWPGGGWNIIIDLEEASGGESKGVLFSSEGEISMDAPDLRNDSGALATIEFQGECAILEVQDGMQYSDGLFNSISVKDDVTTLTYQDSENRKGRAGDLPAVIKTKNGIIIEEIWYEDNKAHRTTGPATITRDDLGNIDEQAFSLDNKRILTKSDWIAGGGVPEAWIDKP